MLCGGHLLQQGACASQTLGALSREPSGASLFGLWAGASGGATADARSERGARSVAGARGAEGGVADDGGPVFYLSHLSEVETFRAMGVQWPPRTLLHGPSGSGKTQLLRWLADRVAPYAEVTWLRPAEVFSRYLGESEERLRNAFAAVQNKEAAVLILEGLDEFVKPSSTDSTGVHGRLAATLLTLLDGIEGPSRTRGLAICASTRRPAVELDGRLTRPGRMDRWLRVSEPNDSERLALLQHFLERSVERRMRSCDPKMKTEMVGATAGMWPGQLRCLAQNAVSRCSISSGGKADLKDEQVWEAVLRALAPSLAPTASASSPSVPSASSLAACLARAAATELPDDDDF
ncbi:unnamed protein product [Durusdinium trenchii]|uniref:AAA+ ATPase domain-containing protein n=1 Tax=Durusdinium trenchii TaxID=1381693 RepID=A0ABP0HM63_9DINO